MVDIDSAPQATTSLQGRRSWRKGFIRLWVVLSVIWISAVVAIWQPWETIGTMQSISAAAPPASGPDLVRIKQNVMRMANAKTPEADIDAYIAQEGATVQDVRDYKLKPWEHYAATGAVVTAPQAEALRNARMRLARSDLVNFALTALLPAAFFFLLGAAVAWIIRGFSHERRV